MKNVARKIRADFNNFLNEISKMALKFFENPESDFTRTKKLPFLTTLRLLLSFGSQSLNGEIKNYFDRKTKQMPSKSAFIQQLDKIKPELFKFIFNEHASRIARLNNFHGYQIEAVDGTEVCKFQDENDVETRVEQKFGFRNAFHVSVIYNYCNRICTSAIIQKGAGYEVKAFIEMLQNGKFDPRTIFVLDRGYESYNLMANVIEKRHFFVLRVKDVTSTGILRRFNLPKDREIDTWIDVAITKKKHAKNESGEGHLIILDKKSPFDFVGTDKNLFYRMRLRIVRIQLKTGKYECIITNLNENEFPPEVIKEIYNLRWSVETSFRELKTIIGLSELHFKKTTSVIKEIYSKLIMYNYTNSIINAVSFKKRAKKYEYKSSITEAIDFCKTAFRKNKNHCDIDVIEAMEKFLTPIKPNRSYKRDKIPKSPPSPNYKPII